MSQYFVTQYNYNRFIVNHYSEKLIADESFLIEEAVRKNRLLLRAGGKTDVLF